MPQALAALVVSALAITGTAAVIATAVLTLAISFGLQQLVSAVFGSGGVSKPSDGQQIIRENVSSRKRHYGYVHVGGILSFYESKNGTLYAVVTTGHGELDSVVQHRLNNNPVNVDGSGLVTDSKYRNAIRIYTRYGADDQTAISQLTSVFPEWTSNHRQRGCSLVAIFYGEVDEKYFSEVYEGNQVPAYSQVDKGAMVYDPRLDSTQVIGYDGAGDPIYGSGTHRLNDTGTWEWSDNWALTTADYLGHVDGYGAGYDVINWVNIAEQADICDETVTTVDLQTIKRWRAWGSYKLADDKRQTVLQEFMKAGDGFIWQDAEGLINIRCGYWEAPTVHLTDDHIINVTASLGGDPQERTNEVRVIYTDSRFDYSETESAPQIDLVEQTRIGRPETQRYDIYYCPHHNQASRLGKRLLTKLSNRWNMTIVCNLYALNLIGERFARITITELDIIGLYFEITSFKLDPKTNLIELGVAQIESSDFDFDAATEEGDPPAEPGDTSPGTITIEAPANLVLVETVGIMIYATWDPTTRTSLSFIAEYEDSSGNIFPMSVNQDERTALSGIVTDGETYTVRVKSVTIAGRESAWTEDDITVDGSAVETAPSTPTQFAATGGSGEAVIDWRNSPEVNFDYAEVFRHTADDFGAASQVGGDQYGSPSQVMQYTDTGLSAGTYYYWVRASSASGLKSSPTASATATVT